MTDIMIPAWVDHTLTPVEKYDAHYRGLKHKAISVFVLDNQDRILLQQRAMCKYHTPGQWANTCCTHPHWDEASETCALRRLEEELGLTGVSLEHKGVVEYRAAVGDDMIEHEVVDLFVGRYDGPISLGLNPEEVMATRWVSLDDLRKNIAADPAAFTPWLRIYLEQHSDMVFREMAAV